MEYILIVFNSFLPRFKLSMLENTEYFNRINEIKEKEITMNNMFMSRSKRNGIDVKIGIIKMTKRDVCLAVSFLISLMSIRSLNNATYLMLFKLWNIDIGVNRVNKKKYSLATSTLKFL